jgi:hypothetical protein
MFSGRSASASHPALHIPQAGIFVGPAALVGV